MADAVTTNVIENTPTHYVVHLTNISDGTGEAAVIKVDKSTLTDNSNPPVEPDALEIEQVRWCIQGMASVRLLWDHATDDLALVLASSGYDDFRGLDNGVRDRVQTGGLKDPRSAGGTGDILLTTSGAISGASYDITLWLKKSTT